MKTDEFEIILLMEGSTEENKEKYESVCRYLLQRYCEGCEEYEGFGLFESINRGASRKRLFDTSPED